MKSFTDTDLSLFFGEEEEGSEGGGEKQDYAPMEGDDHYLQQLQCMEDCSSNASSAATAPAEASTDEDRSAEGVEPASQALGATVRKRTKPERFGVEVFAGEASSLSRRTSRRHLPSNDAFADPKKKRVIGPRARYKALFCPKQFFVLFAFVKVQ